MPRGVPGSSSKTTSFTRGTWLTTIALGAVRELQQCLSELLRAIDASRDAADAEEFSEHLDNLERMCEVVEQADKKLEILTEGNQLLTADLRNIHQQRQEVIVQAKERIEELEAAVHNCEQFDSSLAECQAWCNHVQLILSCRAANDITALDVPHEYKNAFSSGTLIALLQKEFDDFERCFRDLREFVTKNTSDWGSPNRLQLQLDHVADQFEDLIAKFAEFKQPIGLEERAERLLREIADMQINVDELTDVQAQSCKQALDLTKELCRRLTKAKMDLKELSESGKMLAKEQIMTPSAAKNLAVKVDNLEGKLESLSGKNAEIAGRIRHCIAVLDNINNDMQKLDAVLESVESRLDAFVQSGSAGTRDADRATLEALLEDLNKSVPLLAKAENVLQRLKLDSFKIDETMVEQRKRRAIRLEGDLRSWIDAIECKNYDSAELLEHLEVLQDKLTKSLIEMENRERTEISEDMLEKCRLDKNIFVERYRRLLRLDPKVEIRFSSVLSEIEKRWNEVEKKCQKKRGNSSSNPLPPQLRYDTINGTLSDQINLLHDLYKIANDYLDFDCFPVSSTSEWSKRIQNVEDWLAHYKEQLKGIVEEGRRLASSGRMELDVHNVLNSLDKVVDLANHVEGTLQNNKISLLAIQTKAQALEHDISMMESVLDKLEARDLSKSSIASATQRDLLDRQAEIDQLERRSNDLQSCLPGNSLMQPSTVMSKILDKVRDLKEGIDVSIKKNDGEPMSLLHADRQSQLSKEQKNFDAVSTTSTGEQSLALEVLETEDDRSRFEWKKTESSTSEPTSMMMKVDVIAPSESPSSLYIELDKMEEELTGNDPFPFERLQEKKQLLEEMDESFKRVERTIDDSQMMMDLVEIGAARKRLQDLREMKERRVIELNDFLESRNSLEENMEISRELLDNIEEALAEIDSQNKSPELENLECIALSLEDRLRRALSQIQHTSLKAEPILAQIGEQEASQLRDKLRCIGEWWKQCENRVREKKRLLDERSADESELNNETELLQFWCDETETECAITINPINLSALVELASKLEERLNDYERKRSNLHTIEHLKDRLTDRLMDPTTRHRMRRVVSETGKRMSSIRSLLYDRKKELDDFISAAKNFQGDLDNLDKFCERSEKAIQLVESATIFTPSGTDLDFVRSLVPEIEELVQSLERRWKEACSKEPRPDERFQSVVEDTLGKWTKTKKKLASIATLPTLAQDSFAEAVEQADSPSEAPTVLPIINEGKESFGATEYNMVSESGPEEPLTPVMSHKEQLLMNNVVYIGHWLTEVERDASQTVDLSDVEKIRTMINQTQTFTDHLKMRHLDLIRILDESRSQAVRGKIELMVVECSRILGDCQRRKSTLSKMLEEIRAWDKIRSSLSIWLIDVQERVIDGRIDLANELTLKQELKEIQEVTEKANEMKAMMDEVNKRSNDLLDHYRTDEGHNLSHATSKLNTLWSKINDDIRIRRVALEAALQARNDFHSGLEQLEGWMHGMETSLVELNEATSNVQLLKDPIKRKQWIEDEKNVRFDMDAHKDVVRSVEDMGAQLVRRIEDVKEREHFGERLSDVTNRWRHLLDLADAIRTRLLNAQEEWEKLLTRLADNLLWAEAQCKILLDEQPVGGSLARVQEQIEFIRKLGNQLEIRQRDVDECITMVHSYLMQHDLRPRMRSIGILTSNEEDENAEMHHIGIQIRSDSDHLMQKWKELREQLDAWTRIIEDAYTKMEKLAAAVAECQLALSNMEEQMEMLRPVEDLRLEELTAAINESEQLKECLVRTRIHVDDANDWSGQLLASDVDLAPELIVQLKSINNRMAKLKLDVCIRIAALEHAMTDFGPSSQHFLMNSVHAPWQRAISSNHLPYYMNHETEVTQWDHPAMIEIMEELGTFNQVKFSAYRTAMKLRAMQKRLCLDLLTLEDVDSKLQAFSSSWNDECLSMKDAVMCLVSLYEAVQKNYPKLIHSIPLAVDLFLNFVLNVFDSARDGILRTFSFRVLLAVLCSSDLEDKYRFKISDLYQLVANSEGVDQKGLALLLYDIIHIPKFFGEAAAFGGSNVEPSVRSCFEMAKYPRTISIDEFLNWLKREPQSIVWLPVLHRLASAEFAKHQAKCNICKMFPIIGLRYRCLQCFNVDICQNCFFSQRLAKNHKLSHPVQEYCLPTTSGEDVRDFGLIVRNKLRSRSKSRIGYLPVETVCEGPPLESSSITPVNPFTEPVHNRMQLCARRLRQLRGEEKTSALLPETAEEMRMNIAELKSPLQLLSQVEQMHKEELDQVLHKLQHENRKLKKEMERRKVMDNAVGSTPNLTHISSSAITPQNATDHVRAGRSVPSLPNSGDDQLLREAYLLRQHKERLEQRSRILEDQNRQLETQLARLRTIIAQNAESDGKESGREEHELNIASGEEDEEIEHGTKPNRMHSLIASVDQLGRAMESFVVSVVNDNKDSNEDEQMVIGD